MFRLLIAMIIASVMQKAMLMPVKTRISRVDLCAR